MCARRRATEGVLIAHGDATCGYCLFVRDGRLVHDMNVGGAHHLVSPTARFPRATAASVFA